MSGIAQGTRDRQDTDPWRQRVDSADWQAVTAELDTYGQRHTLGLVFHDAP